MHVQPVPVADTKEVLSGKSHVRSMPDDPLGPAFVTTYSTVTGVAEPATAVPESAVAATDKSVENDTEVDAMATASAGVGSVSAGSVVENVPAAAMVPDAAVSAVNCTAMAPLVALGPNDAASSEHVSVGAGATGVHVQPGAETP